MKHKKLLSIFMAVLKGKNGSASAELGNYGTGTHHVDGSFIF